MGEAKHFKEVVCMKQTKRSIALLLAVLMLFGRVGGLSMVMALTGALKSPPVEYPEEKISVG